MKQIYMFRKAAICLLSASICMTSLTAFSSASYAGPKHHKYWDDENEHISWRRAKWERKTEREHRLWLKRKARERKYRLARLEWEHNHHSWKHRHGNRTASFPAPRLDSSATGGLLGAILGGLAGTQVGKGSGRTAAIVGGTVLGAVLGSNIARNMDERDHKATNTALEHNRTGQTSTWENPDTGAQYSLTPQRTYRSTENQDCRDYSMWVFIDGYEEEVKGTACRLPDGNWVPSGA